MHEGSVQIFQCVLKFFSVCVELPLTPCLPVRYCRRLLLQSACRPLQ